MMAPGKIFLLRKLPEHSCDCMEYSHRVPDAWKLPVSIPKILPDTPTAGPVITYTLTPEELSKYRRT